MQMNAKHIQVCMRQLDTHIRYAVSCFTTKGTEQRKKVHTHCVLTPTWLLEALNIGKEVK